MNRSIYPCLWFDGNAAEAAEFYLDTFGKGAVSAHNPIVTMITLSGEPFMLLNGGPQFRPNPAISFYVVCESREELDKSWEKLTATGTVLMPVDKYPWSERYGWVQDRYGVSWQLALGNMEELGQKFSPFLLFCGACEGRAEEAITHYTNIFPDSVSIDMLRHEAGSGEIPGHVKKAQFRINEFVMMAMDSALAHNFGFTEGISLVVHCKTQEEIDFYWEKLIGNSGSESMCGWLKDPFGISWQVVYEGLGALLGDSEKATRVAQRLLTMKKLIISELEQA